MLKFKGQRVKALLNSNAFTRPLLKIDWNCSRHVVFDCKTLSYPRTPFEFFHYRDKFNKTIRNQHCAYIAIPISFK